MVFYFYDMKVLATNIAEPRELVWKGKPQRTGIYKFPVAGPVRLKVEGVEGDLIGNKKVHGGAYKACYLFASEHYAFWKKKYPKLPWDWGMFGENLTTGGLLDTDIQVGDIYQIGAATVQATIPREPCYKLGLKFGDQGIIDAFIAYGHPGAYVRVLEEGNVASGDGIKRVEPAQGSISIRDFFIFLNSTEKDQGLLQRLLHNPFIPEYKKSNLARYKK